MWQWLMVGVTVFVGLLVLLVLWSLLEMAARGEEVMEYHRLENNKDHRLEACATKSGPAEHA